MIEPNPMNRFAYIILTGLLLISSCTDSEKSVADYAVDVKFNSANDYEPFPLSALIDSSTVLHVQSDSLIGAIRDIKYVGGYYYLHDVMNASISKIDSTGRSSLRIQRRGRAMSEYVMLSSFDVNPVSGEISIYDRSQQKMLVYDSNGLFVRQFSMENNYPLSFAVYPNGDYLCYDPEFKDRQTPYGIWIIDENGRFKSMVYAIPSHFRYFVRRLTNNYIARLSDSSFSILVCDDVTKVIHIDEDRSKDYVQFFFDVTIPKTVARDVTPSLEDIRLAFNPSAFGETDKGIVAGFYNGMKEGDSFAYFNKTTGEAYITPVGINIDNDIVNVWSPQKIQSSYNRFFSVLESDLVNETPSLQSAVPYDPDNLNPYIVVSYSK